MPPSHLPPLFAVHISDGVLHTSWLAGGFVVAGLFAAIASWRIRDEEIPRIAGAAVELTALEAELSRRTTVAVDDAPHADVAVRLQRVN
jgi:hypothetical protein